MTKTADGKLYSPRRGGRYERDADTGQRKPVSTHDLPKQNPADKDRITRPKPKKEAKET
ncbi:MAG: hypothetical protein ABJQ71_15110 [Roseibium sp.]